MLSATVVTPSAKQGTAQSDAVKDARRAGSFNGAKMYGKPHIRHRAGIWVCHRRLEVQGQITRYGWGNSPLRAFADWLADAVSY